MALNTARIPLNEVVIVALDNETASDAISTFNKLKAHAGFFKIGLKTYLAGGEGLVQKLKTEGAKVFLDLKFHDIPDQTASAARLMVRMGVDMFTVHASGGPEMLKAVSSGVIEEAQQLKVKPPMVLAVTVLTSLSETESLQIFGKIAAEKVCSFYELAAGSGITGIVCSPLELGYLPGGDAASDRLLRVTPGIRPSSDSDKNGAQGTDDQMRIATPTAAILEGADHIVVGRPITSADDPVEAYTSILQEVAQARESGF